MAQQKQTAPEWPKTVKSGFASVKIYKVAAPKNASGAAYTIAYSEAGKRRLKQYSDEAKAMAEAKRKVALLAAGQHQAANLDAEDAQLLRAIRALCGEVPPLAAMEEWVAACRICDGELIQAAQEYREKRQGEAHGKTVAQVITEFRAAKQALGRDVKKTYKPLDHLAKSELVGLRFGSVTPAILDRYLAANYKHPVYRNTALKRLRTMWHWARSRGYVPDDKQTAPDRLERSREEPLRIGIMDTHDLRKLLKACYDDETQRTYLPALVLSALCGLRSIEANWQTWDDIKLDTAHLRVSKAKRNTPAYRVVPICPAAVAWLRLVTPSVMAGFCCPNRTAIEYPRLLARNIGIDLPDNAFRHSYISHAVAESGKLEQVALDAGTSRQKVYANYRELVTQAEGAAWFASTPEVCGVAG